MIQLLGFLHQTRCGQDNWFSLFSLNMFLLLIWLVEMFWTQTKTKACFFWLLFCFVFLCFLLFFYISCRTLIPTHSYSKKIFLNWLSSCHQTSHFCSGFIGDPNLQLNAFAKSTLFRRVSTTLKKRKIKRVNHFSQYFKIKSKTLAIYLTLRTLVINVTRKRFEYITHKKIENGFFQLHTTQSRALLHSFEFPTVNWLWRWPPPKMLKHQSLLLRLLSPGRSNKSRYTKTCKTHTE